MLRPLSTYAALKPEQVLLQIRAARNTIESLDGGLSDLQARKDDVVSLQLPDRRRLDSAIFNAQDGYAILVQRVTEVTGESRSALASFFPGIDTYQEFAEIATSTTGEISGSRLHYDTSYDNRRSFTVASPLQGDELQYAKTLQSTLFASAGIQP